MGRGKARKRKLPNSPEAAAANPSAEKKANKKTQ
jgi:hypothetical protein